MMTVGDIVRHNAISMPDKLALVSGDERLTYADVNRRTNRMAHALLRAGLGHEDRVAVLGYNTIDYYCLYFATAKIGAILLPMNFWFRAEEHRHVLDNAEPSLVLCQSRFAGIMADATLGLTTRVLEMPAAGETPGPDWVRFIEGLPDSEPDIKPSESWAHMILYTSGTTGRPKGAVLGQARSVLDAFAMSGALCVRQDDVFINYFPPFHVGNWDHMKLFVLAGATTILIPQFDPGLVLELIAKEKITVILSVPTMLNALLTHENFEPTDKSSIRLLYYGAYDPGGILDRAANAFGARQGKIQMAHTYGLTEAGCFVTLCRPPDVFDNWGSIGRAIPGVEVALLDDEGHPVEQGAYGEICVRSPMMTGYWRNPAATAEMMRGGWLHTGDVGVMNERGFLWLVDRKKDMIRTGGQNVYSKEVEDCLAKHPAVADQAVVGLDDPVYEEMVCAIVILQSGQLPGPDLAAEIQVFVKERMAGYNVPKRVEFVAELPKNAVGKVQKHVLRERFGKLPAKTR